MQKPTAQPPASSSVAAAIGNYRWVICALLFFATTINYVDRQILSLIKEILDEELGWSNADFGRVNGAFQGAYGIGLPLFGWFIDRFGTKIGYAVSIAAWSLAAIGHAAVGSAAGFFTARLALGLGEGGNFPSAIKATALWFPKKERAFATSIFNAGTNVGAILAPAIVPWIAYQFGWRAAFIAAGIAGLLWLFLWIPFYNVPDKVKRLSKAELDHIRSDLDEAAADAAGERSRGLVAAMFTFQGRCPRASLWGVGLALVGLSFVFAFVLMDLFTVLGRTGTVVSQIIGVVWATVATLALLSLQARRFHDLGKSTAMIAVPLAIAIVIAAGLRSLAGARGLEWGGDWLKLVSLWPVVLALAGFAVAGFVPGKPGPNAYGPEETDPGLLGHRETWSFIVAKFMTDPIWWFFLIWLPDYFKQTRGLDIKQSWIHLVTIYTIITVLSIAGGWVTGYLTKFGWSVTRARKTGMFIFACCVLPILGVTHVGDWMAVLLIALAGSAHQAWSANLFTTVSDMFPKRAVASVTGIGGLAGAFCGIMFPIYCGKILDKFSAANNVTGGYAILFGICAFAYLVTFAIHHLLAPRFEQVKMK
ncbi:MAG TPA: MFS transporter [Verrucomicrobiota bacterium]|nr:MFS transporter [Verrucomicrobiota bacterium]